MSTRPLAPPLALALLAIFACGRAESPASEPAPAPEPVSAPATISGHQSAAENGADREARKARVDGSAVEVAGLRFELPGAFRSEPPASPMRLFQAAVSGDAGPAELVVFHFGAGQGGTADANFERWIGQFERPAGTAPERGELAAGGMKVQWIALAGTLLPSGMGMGPTTPQPGSALLGAVVEGEGGPWFFKLTGPEATVAAARPPFLSLLGSLRRAG